MLMELASGVEYLFGPSHDIQALTQPQNTVPRSETDRVTAPSFTG